MKIFHIISNCQAYDGDGWSYWLEHNHYEYFLNKEDAEKEISKKVDIQYQELCRQSEERVNEGYDPINAEYIDKIRNNIITISEGDGRRAECTDYPLYEIRVIDVL